MLSRGGFRVRLVDGDFKVGRLPAGKALPPDLPGEVERPVIEQPRPQIFGAGNENFMSLRAERFAGVKRAALVVTIIGGEQLGFAHRGGGLVDKIADVERDHRVAEAERALDVGDGFQVIPVRAEAAAVAGAEYRERRRVEHLFIACLLYTSRCV